MSEYLHGRYGPYKPKTTADKSKARKQAEARRTEQLQRRAWLERYSECLNGCGKPVAFWDEIHLSLRYGGCCSPECEECYKAKSNEGEREIERQSVR